MCIRKILIFRRDHLIDPPEVRRSADKNLYIVKKGYISIRSILQLMDKIMQHKLCHTKNDRAFTLNIKQKCALERLKLASGRLPYFTMFIIMSSFIVHQNLASFDHIEKSPQKTKSL